MLKYFVFFGALVLECRPEVPVVRDGCCRNFVPEPMPIENFYGKQWRELARSNVGEGRTQWCLKFQPMEVNETVAIWNEAYYDITSSTQEKSSHYLTGSNGDFTFTNRQTGMEIKRIVLGYTPDYIVLYSCVDIPFYSYVEYISGIATYDFPRCDVVEYVTNILNKYQIENSLVSTVQGNEVCCQICPD